MSASVSVIITIYYPKKEKLIPTLNSVLMQKGVDFEIVLADDGTPDFDDSWIKDFFGSKEFKNYRIIHHERNVGTVKNEISAVEASEGTYIKSISPGDLLYDENTLAVFRDYCEKNHADIVFGNSVYYAKNGDSFSFFPDFHYPFDIAPYTKPDYRKQKNVFLIYHDVILALSYFFKKELYLRYLKKIEGKAKYAEDTCFFLMVADGIEIPFFNRNIVWYEYGEGISTSSSDSWQGKIRQDMIEVGNVLVAEHPEWKIFNDMNQKRLTPKVALYVLGRRRYFKKKWPRYFDYDPKLIEKIFK